MVSILSTGVLGTMLAGTWFFSVTVLFSEPAIAEEYLNKLLAHG